MTPQDHNRVIGIMHLIYGGFNALMMLIFVPLFLIMGSMISLDPTAPGEIKFVFIAFGLFFLGLALILGLPSLIAGYGMMKRKQWARTAGIVAACFSAISFPFGTALCVYTLWFHFGEGKNFNDSAHAHASSASWGSLPNASGYGWEAQGARRPRQPEYAPPPQPPNWRDEN